jgi:hypothetical protein
LATVTGIAILDYTFCGIFLDIFIKLTPRIHVYFLHKTERASWIIRQCFLLVFGRRQVRISARAKAVMTRDLNGFPQFFETNLACLATNNPFKMISCLFIIKCSETLIESTNKQQKTYKFRF